MALQETIKNFASQFAYEPKIINEAKFQKADHWIVAGMGGSHLAADLLQQHCPRASILVHHNYGLPTLSDDLLARYLLIASSYSGNTEEALDAFDTALGKGMRAVAVSRGGMLLDRARKAQVPHIQLPNTGLEPRFALGYQLKALLAFVGDEAVSEDADALSELLRPEEYEKAGMDLAGALLGKVPVIYASERNGAVAYNWKIKFNETAKIPAFYNTFPELNHNEMTGFDKKDGTWQLSERFHIVLLKDGADHPRVQKRMEVLEALYRDRGLLIETVEMRGETPFHKTFASLVLADWTTYYLAEHYGVDPESVPMVETFKERMKS